MKFSPANTKLERLYKVPQLAAWLTKRKVYSFDILSGHSCPFAKDCHSKVVETPDGRKIQDGPDTEFRCFSASAEVVFPGTYNARKGNFENLRGKSAIELVKLIAESLPDDLGICRIHVAGDFFNAAYFKAWVVVAELFPDRLFYAYTKSLPYWVDMLGDIPDNLILTASRGGRRDDLISEHNLRSVKVVFSEAEAELLGLDIDHDDSHASRPDLAFQDFALLIHGIQPAGSEAGKAVRELNGLGSYKK